MTTSIRTRELSACLCRQMEGPRPFDRFISNGCTCSPDFIGGVDLRPACHWHDFAYLLGGDEDDREKADYALYRNLRRCGLSAWHAGVYFRRVRLAGVRCFAYCDPPRGWRLVRIYLRVLVGRYLRW